MKSSSCNGCLVTASADKLVKVWDIKESEAKFIKEIEPQVGTILSLSANPDYPFVFAVSGDSNADNFKVLDISLYKAGLYCHYCCINLFLNCFYINLQSVTTLIDDILLLHLIYMNKNSLETIQIKLF